MNSIPDMQMSLEAKKKRINKEIKREKVIFPFCITQEAKRKKDKRTSFSVRNWVA